MVVTCRNADFAQVTTTLAALLKATTPAHTEIVSRFSFPIRDYVSAGMSLSAHGDW